MYNNINLFVQLIDAGNFSRLAQKMHAHQSTISKRIMSLEQELGLVLINRNTRNFQLTEHGVRLYEQSKHYFGEFNVFLNSIRNNIEELPEGRLTIAMSPSLSTTEVNSLILDFTNLYPNVMLDIHYVINEVNLLKDNFDAAITLSKPLQETAVIKTVWQVNTILCATPEYIQRFGAPLTLADLEQHRIILPLLSMRTNKVVEGIHAPTNRMVTQKFNRYSIAVNSSANNLNFAMTGKCIVPLYECIAEDYISAGKLIQILPEYQAIPSNVYLARPSSYKNKLVDLFANHVTQCLQNRETLLSS
jgi:LysR family transcriptional regulator for bpeEF and oprC